MISATQTTRNSFRWFMLVVFASSAASAYGVDFDWSMPDRFGLDNNNDGLIDYFTTRESVSPGEWTVNFNACGNSGNPKLYRWLVNGERKFETPACKASLQFPREATYVVTLEVEFATGPQAKVSHNVIVQDWLIFGLGDSYGSGEGNPDIPIPQAVLNEIAAFENEMEEIGLDLQELAGEVADAATELGQVNADATILQTAFERAQAACTGRFDPLACAEALSDLQSALAVFVDDVIDEFSADLENLVNTAIDGAVAFAEERLEQAEDALADLEDLQSRLAPKWQNARCHRSAWAGEAQAALQLEKMDSKTSVTFVHLACSGATIRGGLIGPYAGTEVRGLDCDRTPEVACKSPKKNECYPSQLEQAACLAGDREVDAMLLSIGGNDANFGPIAQTCMRYDKCYSNGAVPDSLFESFVKLTLCTQIPQVVNYDECVQFLDEIMHPEASAGELATTGLARLKGGYEDVAAEIARLFPDFPDKKHVFLTEYGNAVRDEHGELCDFDFEHVTTQLPVVPVDETDWVEKNMITPLNAGVAAGARMNGWTLVDGVFSGFNRHGYCSKSGYFVRVQDSFQIQGGYHGTLHPNRKGHSVRAAAIVKMVVPNFYARGSLDHPRAPLSPPVPMPDGPISLLEGTRTRLTDHSFDPNGDEVNKDWALAILPGGASRLEDESNPAGPTLVAIDDARGLGVLEVWDDDEADYFEGYVPIEIRNASPRIIKGTKNLVIRKGASGNFSSSFTDAGTKDTHTAKISWGDGSQTAASVIETNGSGTAKGTHSYQVSGLYDIKVQVRDDDGGETTGDQPYAVVFDPSRGAVSGTAKFISPGNGAPEALKFDLRYASSAAPIPTGSFDWQGTLRFDQPIYEWLVIRNGSEAIFRGGAKVNGTPVNFLVSVKDSRSQNVKDTIRVKIWNQSSGQVIYDTKPGASETASASTKIIAGDIKVVP